MRARLKVSRAGVELIKSFEGLRQTAARLPDGRWTLGYGHTFSARDGATVTQEDADALLRFDLLPIVDSINNLALVPLNQNQFDALVSFCFNIGVDNFATSGVLKRINEGRMTEAALAMDSWRSAEFNGQTYVLAPLIRRRAAEKNLFLTPEEMTGNAPSLLVRPVEDAAGEQPRPTEVDAPDRNGILSARPMSDTPAFVAEAAPTTFTPPFEISATPQTYAPPPVERQVIDLASFAPRAPDPLPMAPSVKPTIVRMADVSPMVGPQPAPVAPPVLTESVVEQLPFGLASTGALRETPSQPAPGVVEQSPTAYDYDPVPVMSPEVQAALARAQDEQRQQDQRLRDEARLREEARLQELQRQEYARLEAARAEQARAEAFRVEQERLAREEQMRAELARLEQARLEQTYLEQARLEVERQERERQEAARVEAERAEALRLEQQRAEQMRIEAARLESARLESARLEAVRLESERAEAARAEALRVEQERIEQARLEQARQEAQKQGQAAQVAQAQPAPPASDDEAEKLRKAEAAAALMRLYSPYGGGTLGRPLTPQVLQPAPEPAPRPEVKFEVKSDPQPEPVRAEPAKQSAPQVDSDPLGLSIQSEDEIRSVSSFILKPPPSASQMPAPQITALNPYARPVLQPTPTSEAIVEVPRPAPVDLATPSAKADAPLHWREQLQRPLPQDFTPQPEQPEQASLLRSAHNAHFDAAVEDEVDDWTNDAGRIALSAEEMEEETVSFWKMLSTTVWWVLISCFGLACLGFAAAAYVRAVNDPNVLRSGNQGDLTMLSVIAAAAGIFFVCVSVWLIMKRLGGLKD